MDCWKIVPWLLTVQMIAVETGAQEPEAAPQQVIIKRQPLRLIPARDYQMSFSLEPVRSVQLMATVPGVVRLVNVKSGDKTQPGAPAVQLDSATQTLELERAKLAVSLAQLQAKEGDAEIGRTRLEIARKEQELAQAKMEQLLIKTPFEGTIFRVRVTPGQYVDAGEPLLTVADLSRLRVEIPVDRNKVQAGQTVAIRVEDQDISGVVEVVLPAPEGFEKLRELVPGLAAAVVVLDNGGRQLSAGQTVFADLIPRDPVVEIPNSALQNLAEQPAEDQRMVQVVRDLVIRNVTVKLLGSVGTNRTFVTGLFQEGDELITSSSVPLTDGTQVRPSTPGPTSKPGAPAKNTPMGTNPQGF